MHVAPAGFRAIRNGAVTVRFAVVGDVACVLADLSRSGSSGTVLEDVCDRPHWGFVARGSLVVIGDAERWEVGAGNAFHVPSGLSHRLHSDGAAQIVGFERLSPGTDVSDERLAAEGFEIVRGAVGGPTVILPGPASPPAEGGEITTEGVRMGDLIMCQTSFGSRSGYTSPFCDLEHWGLVTAGSLAIEWETDIEVLTAGDVFYCPPGPPGHRFHAADPAASIDFTPIDAFEARGRVVDWRRDVAARLRSRPPRRIPRVETAALR